MMDTKEKIIDELHRQARKNFVRRRVYVKGIDDVWQVDLIEFNKHARTNGGNRYILTVIDVLSKFAWAEPLRRKTGTDVTSAMEKVFAKSQPRLPTNIQSDDGKEFYNKWFSKLMERHGINHYSTFSPLKASVVERFNRTLKTWMYKAFGVQGTYKWATNGLLDDLIKKYNSRVHRSIGMRPDKVKRKHEKELVTKLNTPLSDKKPRYKVNDIVRISKWKTQFEKGYTPSWTTELFSIYKVRNTQPPVYMLRDLNGSTVRGAFYEQELQKTKYPDTYLVEKVLRKKGSRVYVKWLGMSSDHNSWI